MCLCPLNLYAHAHLRPVFGRHLYSSGGLSLPLTFSATRIFFAIIHLNDDNVHAAVCAVVLLLTPQIHSLTTQTHNFSQLFDNRKMGFHPSLELVFDGFTVVLLRTKGILYNIIAGRETLSDTGIGF